MICCRLLIHIIFCTAKTKLPASIRSGTKQANKKSDTKNTPVNTPARVNPPRMSRNQVFASPVTSPQHSVMSSCVALPPPQQQPSMHRRMNPPLLSMTLPPSPDRLQQTQRTRSSNNDSEMIARLMGENKALQEKLNAIISKENTAPPSPLLPVQPGPRFHPENGRDELSRAVGNPQQGYPRYYPEHLDRDVNNIRHCGPYPAQFAFDPLEARLREERMSAVLYQRERELQREREQRDQELQLYFIRYGYPHNSK